MSNNEKGSCYPLCRSRTVQTIEVIQVVTTAGRGTVERGTRRNMQVVTYGRTQAKDISVVVPPPISVTVIDSGMTLEEVAHAIVWCRGYTSMEAFFQELERRASARVRHEECPELYDEGGVMFEEANNIERSLEA